MEQSDIIRNKSGARRSERAEYIILEKKVVKKLKTRGVKVEQEDRRGEKKKERYIDRRAEHEEQIVVRRVEWIEPYRNIRVKRSK